MLTQIKNYVIIALLIALSVQSYRVKSAQHERDLKASEVATLQTVIDHAQAVYKQQTERLRLREQEAAKRAKQSQKHTDSIMRQKVPADCRKAIEWMISAADQK